jgi:hypothetical protein
MKGLAQLEASTSANAISASSTRPTAIEIILTISSLVTVPFGSNTLSALPFTTPFV